MHATEKRTFPHRRRVYLLRHGEVDYFDAQGRPYRPNDVPLNADGWRQAAAVAAVLAEVPFDRAVCSDLRRSVQTASVVLADKGPPLETRQELREIQPGRLANLQEGEIEAVFTGAFRPKDEGERFLGGETFGSLMARVRGCFQALLADRNWQHLLLVAHGGVNRVLLCDALGCGTAGFAGLEQDAGCLNILDVDEDGRCLVRLVNHTPYDVAKRGLVLTTMERLYQQYRRRT